MSKSGVKFIVQHPIKGRIACIAMGSIADALAMVGMPCNGGVCIAVHQHGRPVRDNEPAPYRMNKPIATRKHENLCEGISHNESLRVEPVRKPIGKYMGHLLRYGAAVDNATTVMDKLVPLPKVIATPAESLTHTFNAANELWLHMENQEPERFDLTLASVRDKKEFTKPYHEFVIDHEYEEYGYCIDSPIDRIGNPGAWLPSPL